MQSDHHDYSDYFKQQSSIQQGHRIRLALECLAGESLASRLERRPQPASETTSSLNADHGNSENPDANDADANDAGRYEEAPAALPFRFCSGLHRPSHLRPARHDGHSICRF